MTRPQVMPFILQKLKEHRGSLPEKVCAPTGIPYGTLAKIINGQVANPRIGTVEKLLDLFDYWELIAASAAPAQEAETAEV